jgi:hypothetical protein
MLNITAFIPINVYSSDKSLDYIYHNIYNVIKENPAKYKYIIDLILNDGDFITYFPPSIRNAISMLYPEDKELTIKLMICTTSYYKCKRVDTDECDEDGEPIERTIYHLVPYCPEYYFKLHFYKYYNTNHTLRGILGELNVKSSDVEYYKVSPELIKYYNEKRTIV